MQLGEYLPTSMCSTHTLDLLWKGEKANLTDVLNLPYLDAISNMRIWRLRIYSNGPKCVSCTSECKCQPSTLIPNCSVHTGERACIQCIYDSLNCGNHSYVNSNSQVQSSQFRVQTTGSCGSAVYAALTVQTNRLTTRTGKVRNAIHDISINQDSTSECMYQPSALMPKLQDYFQVIRQCLSRPNVVCLCAFKSRVRNPPSFLRRKGICLKSPWDGKTQRNKKC